ncbi:hypothetical protein CBR_g36362 [Chara braunii]|uniref:Uncharacterized protein n=1 Tax=Chara braunii TaxID=69332 RepID=A0A388LKT2_CHABU|nr:hypothetical protein CBR_g36362 [Chara braunii]|eukprot:GBG82832.1 hypothetical protein CBR_g36362 [Chara braunii]
MKATRQLDYQRVMMSTPMLTSTSTRNRGLCNSHLDLHKRAVKDYTRALEVDPRLLKAWIQKGQSLMRLRRNLEAQQSWQHGAQFASSGIQDLDLCLELEELASGTLQAEPMAQTRASPSISEANQNLIGSGSGASTSSARQIISNCRANQNSQANHLSLIRNNSNARNVEIEGNFMDVAELERALSEGIDKVNTGRLDEAIDDFNRLLEKVPRFASALVTRGTALALQGKLEAAVQDFTQAIECSPKQIEAWKRRGQARAALGLEAEVLSDYAEALRIDPNCSDVYLQRGMFHYKLKDFQSAEADMRTTIEKDPNNKQAWNFLVWELIFCTQSWTLSPYLQPTIHVKRVLLR